MAERIDVTSRDLDDGFGHHELKCWPEFFAALWDGRKTAELRRDDRGFALLDHLRLREFDPASGQYTGRSVSAEITHILTGPGFGLAEGYVMLSLNVFRRDPIPGG